MYTDPPATCLFALFPHTPQAEQSNLLVIDGWRWKFRFPQVAMSQPKKSSVKNSTVCQIPGFLNPVIIPFPESKLPVCARCKKAFRARSLCRERDAHLTLPWKSTYACIQLDDSCLSTDDQGRHFLLSEKNSNIQFVAQLEEPSTLYETVLIPKDSDYPMCTRCKEVKNYSRVHCRYKDNHRDLPWNVFHMKLYAVYRSSSSDSASANIPSSSPKSRTENECVAVEAAGLNENVHTKNGVDDLTLEVPDSKAFLLIIGSDDCSLHWLDDKSRIESEFFATGYGPLIGNSSMLHNPELNRSSDTMVNDNWVKYHNPGSGSVHTGYYSNSADSSRVWAAYHNAAINTSCGLSLPSGTLYPKNPYALAPVDSIILKQNQNVVQNSPVCRRVSLLSTEKMDIVTKYDDFDRNAMGTDATNAECRSQLDDKGKNVVPIFHSHASELVISESAMDATCNGSSTRRVSLVYNPLGSLSNPTDYNAERYCQSSLTYSHIPSPHHLHSDCYEATDTIGTFKNRSEADSAACPLSQTQMENLTRNDNMSTLDTSSNKKESSMISSTKKNHAKKRSMDGITADTLASSFNMDANQHVTMSTSPAQRSTVTRRVSLPAQSSIGNREKGFSYSAFDKTMQNPHSSFHSYSVGGIGQQQQRRPRRMSAPHMPVGKVGDPTITPVPILNHYDPYGVVSYESPHYVTAFPYVLGHEENMSRRVSIQTSNMGHGGIAPWKVPIRDGDLRKKTSEIYRSNEVESNFAWTEAYPFGGTGNVSRRVSIGYPPFRMNPDAELNPFYGAQNYQYPSFLAVGEGRRRVSILKSDCNNHNTRENTQGECKDAVNVAAWSDATIHSAPNHDLIYNRTSDLEDINAFKSQRNVASKRTLEHGAEGVTGNTSSPGVSRRNSFNQSMFGLETSIERRVSFRLDYPVGLDDALVDDAKFDGWFRKSQDSNEEYTGSENGLNSALRLKIPSRRLSDSSWSIPFLNFDDDDCDI